MNKLDIEKIIQERKPKDINELNQILEEETRRFNDSPVEAFCGISPNQMRFLLYDPFNENSPFGFQDHDPAVLDNCPFFLLAEDMLRRTVLTSSPFKMTVSSCALPVKVVKDLYEHSTLKDESVESGIVKLYKEVDCDFIHVCKIVLEQAGIVRKQHNKWHLTKKGEKLVQPNQRGNLFRNLFQTFTLQYNWAHLDLYDHPSAGQECFAFSLYLLAQFGETDHEVTFYAKKYLTAFPMLQEEIPAQHWIPRERRLIDIFVTRFFSRFAYWWGLAEAVGEISLFHPEKQQVRKGDLLAQLFRMPEVNI